VNNELERIWQEAIVAYLRYCHAVFKVLQEKNLRRAQRVASRGLLPGPIAYKAEVPTVIPTPDLPLRTLGSA
jgi:hypothetical protein